MKNKNVRGFTLAEMMVVVGIVAILGTVTITSFMQSQRRQETRQIARRFVQNVWRARQIATSGRVIDNTVVPPVRAVQAGIRLDTQSKYVLFMDQDEDATNGNEVTVDIVEWDNPNIKLLDPGIPDGQVRFTRRGTLSSVSSPTFTIEGEGNRRVSVALTYSGNAKVY